MDENDTLSSLVNSNIGINDFTNDEQDKIEQAGIVDVETIAKVIQILLIIGGYYSEIDDLSIEEAQELVEVAVDALSTSEYDDLLHFLIPR